MADSEPDPEQSRKMHEFMRFAVDTGLVEMCLDENDDFAYYIPEGASVERPPASAPHRKPFRHRARTMGALGVALLLGVLLGVVAPRSEPFVTSATTTMTGASLTSPVFEALAGRLNLTCNQDRPGHADCSGPKMSAEIFEHIGEDNTEFTIMSHTGTDPGDETTVRFFTSVGAANRWLGQIRSLGPYPNLAAHGSVVSFGTDTSLVKVANAVAPAPPRGENRGLLVAADGG